jgi:hypothetical protein
MRGIIINFLQDRAIQVSAISSTVMLSKTDIVIKVAFGLPSALYVTIKLLKELKIIKK